MSFENRSQCLWAVAGFLVGGMAMSASSASAALIASESFETYSTETGSNGLAGKGGVGNGWTGDWSAVPGVTVVDINGVGQPTLSYVGTEFTVNGGTKAAQIASGNENHLMSRAFAAQSDTVYMSMLLKQTVGVDPSSQTDFIQFGLTDTTAVPNIDQSGTFNTGNATNNNRFAARLIAEGADVSTVQTGTNIVEGQAYFLVLRLSKSSSATYNHLDFAINPNNLTESSNTFFSPANKALTASEITTFIGRLARMDAGDTILVDEIRIGSDWTSVVAVPEPGSLSMAAIAGASLLSRRRRIVAAS